LQNVSFILIFIQNLSPLREDAEGADFPQRNHDPVGVAGGVAYNLVLLTRIPVV